MKRFMISAVTGCLLALPAGATGIALPSMMALDADVDGKIQIGEMQTWARREVLRYDGDGDGLITAEEIRSADLGIAEDQVDRFVGFLDRDESGSLSEREAISFFSMGFIQFDVNGDTVVDADEWSRAVQMLVEGAQK